VYESNIGLIGGLGKKSLRAKKGIVINPRGEGMSLQGKKKA
jgi:hypothetical protein